MEGEPDAATRKAKVAATPEAFLRVDPASSREQYRWMERFVTSVTDEPLRERLLVAIDGKGAFRRFKDVLLSFRPSERGGSPIARTYYTFKSKRGLTTQKSNWPALHLGGRFLRQASRLRRQRPRQSPNLQVKSCGVRPVSFWTASPLPNSLRPLRSSSFCESAAHQIFSSRIQPAMVVIIPQTSLRLSPNRRPKKPRTRQRSKLQPRRAQRPRLRRFHSSQVQPYGRFGQWFRRQPPGTTAKRWKRPFQAYERPEHRLLSERVLFTRTFFLSATFSYSRTTPKIFPLPRVQLRRNQGQVPQSV